MDGLNTSSLVSLLSPAYMMNYIIRLNMTYSSYIKKILFGTESFFDLLIASKITHKLPNCNILSFDNLHLQRPQQEKCISEVAFLTNDLSHVAIGND